MMGVPDEVIDEIQQTLEIMYEIEPDFASVSIYEPFPGTPMFTQGIEKGLVRAEMTLEDFFNISPNNYYKVNPDKQLEAVNGDDFLAVAEDVKKEFHIYNTNFKRLWRRAKSRTGFYFARPCSLWSDFKKFLSWR